MWRFNNRWSVKELLQISHLYFVSSPSIKRFLSCSSFVRFDRQSCCGWGVKNGWLWRKKWLPSICGTGVSCGILGHSEESRWCSEMWRRLRETSRRPSKDARTGIDSEREGMRWSRNPTSPKLPAVSGKLRLSPKGIDGWRSVEQGLDVPFLVTVLISLGGGGRFCNSNLEVILLQLNKSLRAFELSTASSRVSCDSGLANTSLSFLTWDRWEGDDISFSTPWPGDVGSELLASFSSLLSMNEFPWFNSFSSGNIFFSSRKQRRIYCDELSLFLKLNSNMVCVQQQWHSRKFKQ